MTAGVLSRLAALSLAASFLAADAFAEKALSREEHLARRREAVARRAAESGGFVEKVTDGGKVRIVDAQSIASPETVKNVASSIQHALKFVVAVDKGEPKYAYRPSKEHPVVITLSDTGEDATILVAPEQAWAVVSTAALSKDAPSEAVLADRVQKEIWRALALILGASNSKTQPCVMRQINTLQDLDAVQTKMPSPAPFPMMSAVASKLNVSRVYTATYKKACQEGWAPAPTNDIQKAIWDQVHAVPKNPMKIEFDPKKGR